MSRTGVLVAATILLRVFFVPIQAWSDICTAYPTDDAEVASNFPTINACAINQMYIGYEPSGRGISRTFIRFSLSCIPPNSTINSVSLCLRVSDINTTDFFTVHKAASPWTECAVVWNNQPSVDPNPVISGFYVTQNDKFTYKCLTTVALRDMVQNWVNGTPNYGIRIKKNDEGSSGDLVVQSKEGSFQPYLQVNYSSGSISNVSISPNPPEIGSTAAISWASTGSIGNTVKIEVFNGSSWVLVASSVSNVSGNNNWPWPIANGSAPTNSTSNPSANWAGTGRQIKISSNSSPSISGTSPTFNIEGFVVASPNGGEVWQAGTQHDVSWIKTGGYTTIHVELSTDGGSTWDRQTPVGGVGSTSPYSWNIPSDINSTTCRIRVRDLRSEVNDISDANFSITPSALITNVGISPNPPEIGSNATISWTSTGNVGTTVRIELFNGASWVTVEPSATNVEGINYRVWGIPNGSTYASSDWAGTGRQIKVTSNIDPTISENSPIFSIEGFVIIVPNGGEVWYGGTVHDILWTKTGGYTTIHVDLSTDGGNTWSPKTGFLGTSSTPPFTLTIPTEIQSSNCRIRIRDYLRSSVNDISNGNFSIFTDTDGDGLLDDWEVNGYDYDNDGNPDVNLPGMGANPLHKDIFVEIDWMAAGSGETRSHKPCIEAIDSVVAAFGRNGIALHVDYGQDGQGGDFTEGNEIPQHYEYLDIWGEFESLKILYFKPVRHRIFHYCIFGHLYKYDGINRRSSGISRNPPYGSVSDGASDFLVTYPGLNCSEIADVIKQGGTFMHELGHNLGLDHGGQDTIKYKPNYLSVMNYTFQFTGLRYKGKDNRLDYSQFSDVDLPDLTENNLDEGVGLKGSSNTSDYGSRFCPYAGSCGLCGADIGFKEIPQTNVSVDWNLSGGNPEATVSANINAGVCASGSCDYPKQALKSYSDWDKLVFTGGSVGGAGVPAESLPMEPPEFEELTIDEAQFFCLAKPGDANADGLLTLADIIATVNYIFNKPGCSEPPLCWLSNSICRGDWNGSNTVSLVDVIQGVNFIFNKPGGPWTPVPIGVCCLPIQ